MSKRKYTRTIWQCEYCGKDFPTKPSLIRRGQGRFCSKPCRWDVLRDETLQSRFSRQCGPVTTSGCSCGSAYGYLPGTA